jgi:hypothetical protein
MKTKITAILFLLTTIVANAGDTIFSSPPNTREWNSTYIQQKFVDEFNGTSLNTNLWDVDLCRSRGYSGNNEGEPNNIAVSNGTLKLTARYSPGNIDNNCSENTHFVTDYTTAEIWSKWNNYRYKYGSFEALCFMPRGDHYYYAYWLWGPGGGGYPQDGFTSEIDIAEGTSWRDASHHNMKSTFHYWPQPGDQIPLPDDASYGYGTGYEGAWHIYKIVWNPYEVIFYIDSNEVWRRSKYYTGSDLKANDVGMNQIQTNVTYHKRDWFPNDEMITIFQMHITEGISLADLPVSMQVDYVKIKQFFLAPEITCPSIICSTGTATMDVDPLATNITWQLTPSYLFTVSSGNGSTANIVRVSGANGAGKITYSFQMPSGETFTAQKDIWVGPPIIRNVSGPRYNQVGASATYSATVDGISPTSSYNWNLTPGIFNNYFNPGGINCYVTWYRAGEYVLTVNAQNTCPGTSPTYYYPISVASGRYLSISPNPTSGETTLELVSNSSEESLKQDIEWSFEIYDSMQGMKEKKTKIKDKQAKVNTSNWKEGVYFVRAKIGDETISGKLLVKP